MASSSKLVHGGIGVGAATTLASAANYLSNVVLGRGLGPDGFADAALVVSAMLLVGAIALGFQLTVARHVATGAGVTTVVRLRRLAATAGALIGGALIASSTVLGVVFHMSSPWPLVVFGAGIPVYFVMAVGRGVAQATHAFGRLAASLAVEAAARLLVTVAAVGAGLGATGASVALVFSFIVAAGPCRAIRVDSSGVAPERVGSRRVAGATVLLLFGQVVISNGDLWVVAAIVPDDAGSYAAVALIGRLVFITAWSIVTVVFPSLAAEGAGHRARTDRLLWQAVAITAVFGGSATLGAALFGERLLTMMVGAGYIGGADLLWPYSLATTLFVLANLFAVADVAVGRVRGPAVVAVGGLVQTLVLSAGGSAGVAWVVWAQVAVMGALLAAAATTACVRPKWSGRTHAVGRGSGALTAPVAA